MQLPEKPPDWAKILKEKKVFEVLDNKDIFAKILEYNKRYLYWDELRYRIRDEDVRKSVWTLMKFMRSEKYEEISFADLDLKYVILPAINKHLHRFDRFLAGNIEIQTRKLGLEKRYIVSSLMEEAIASSMIEGAATTRKAAKEMLKQKKRPKDSNEQMVVNGYDTMQMIVKRKDDLLTPEFLLEIQASITRGTLDRTDVGSFRDNDDIVVGHDTHAEIIYHTPPRHEEIKGLIEDLCDFANDDEEEFIHPVIKGIILHFLIGYIHPFNDGNGRTARSVFYWYVLSRGYWLFEYMAVSRRILKSKKQYGMAYLFTELDGFDLTYFIKYNLEAIEDSLDDLMGYLKSKQEEQKEVQAIIEKIKGLNYRQASILEEIMKNPDKSFTIQEISETYDVVYETARTDLLLLHEMGYLDAFKAGKKFMFRFDENSRKMT